CHGMASPHPTLPLTKFFFFPGFTVKTGGLLREAHLLPDRDRYQHSLPARDHLEIGLFCYDTAPVGGLLAALATTVQPSLVHVPRGKPLAAVMQYLPGNGPWQHGNARIEPIPFMPQDDYDRLLWRCDINFIRGEDSFVRAQWAAKPFVWQIYQQEEEAHLVKLSAFLDRYCAAMGDTLAHVIREMFVAWNGGEPDVACAFQHFVDNRQAVAEANHAWCDDLASQDDLATTLVNFCASKV
ncbi:MAG: elongation factor P maturation arginine rhamnosyltransferase EarP, partial [Betaproteobacteria bacterium]|nr:elongation factor P maturation arginine rhamnosyltransferase EarP [Betaproteobacteria bacterium]